MRMVYVSPSDLRLVIGKGTVAKLAGTAPALAVNCSYFDPASMAIWSNVAQGGKVLGNTGRPHPWLAVKGGRAWFGRSVIDPATVDWAAGAGPMLLIGGTQDPVLAGENYGSDIVPGGETTSVQRMAVGITADGRVCIITLRGTFGDLRRELLAAGCVDAMNLDGGSSAQWVERGQLIEGAPRLVVNALVADKVQAGAPPAEYEISQMLLPLGREHNRPGTPLKPQGIIMHETATPNATPEDEAKYFAAADRNASAHYFVGPASIVQIIPENEQAQHAGPTANSRFLGIEICHFDDPARFAATWQRTVWLAATLCRRYGWAAGPNIYSHKWASETSKETNHADPYSYFVAHGKTFQQFCDDVDAMIKSLGATPPAADPEVEQLRTRIVELEGQLAANAVIISDLRSRVDAAKKALQ